MFKRSREVLKREKLFIFLFIVYQGVPQNTVAVTTRATSVVEGRKEGRNNWKEYHSTSRARKVRSKIVASYCNILKVSRVLAFSTLGHYSFLFYRRMEGALRLTYGIIKVYNL